jgi:hypothetical protein
MSNLTTPTRNNNKDCSWNKIKRWVHNSIIKENRYSKFSNHKIRWSEEESGETEKTFN